MKKWKEVLMVLGGSVVMGLSIDLFVRADLGLDPLSLFQAGLGRVSGLGEAGMDAMMMYLSGRLKKNVNGTRVGLDLLLSAAGLLLGGKAGIATVLSMAVNGYAIQKTIEVIEGLRKRPLQEQASE